MTKGDSYPNEPTPKSLGLRPTPIFWQRLLDFIDTFALPDEEKPGTYGYIDEFLSETDIFEPENDEDHLSIWCKDVRVWVEIANSEDLRKGKPRGLAKLLESIIGSIATHRGVKNLIMSVSREISMRSFRRLRFLASMADNCDTEPIDPWNDTWKQILSTPIEKVLDELLDKLINFHDELSYAGVQVVRIKEFSEVFDDANTFARTRLYFDPAFEEGAVRWRQPKPLSLESFCGELREDLESCNFKVEGPPRDEVVAKLDQLEMVATHHDPELEVNRLTARYPLTCCGSTQWLIRGSQNVVLQLYQFC